MKRRFARKPDCDTVDSLDTEFVVGSGPSLSRAVNSFDNAQHVSVELRHGCFGHVGMIERMECRSEVVIESVLAPINLANISDYSKLAVFASTANPASLGDQTSWVEADDLNSFAFSGSGVESRDMSIVDTGREIDDILTFRAN